MINKNNNVECIVCPKCGREYLPAEIYLPNQFLGRPEGISRFTNGKIDNFDGYTMNLEETYICDNCDTEFKTTAKVSFKTQIVNKTDFSQAYVTHLFEDTFTLPEDTNDSNN